jgi:hypothetical protein
MPTVAVPIGTTAYPAVVSDKLTLEDNIYADVIIQNLSGNNVYVNSEQTGTTSSGLKIAAGGTYTNDHRAEPIFLIADGASSDCRIEYFLFRDTQQKKV